MQSFLLPLDLRHQGVPYGTYHNLEAWLQKFHFKTFKKKYERFLSKFLTSLSKSHFFFSCQTGSFLITLIDLPIEFGEFGKDDPEEAVDEDVDKGLEAVGMVGIDGEISAKSWSFVSDCQSNCILAK